MNLLLRFTTLRFTTASVYSIGRRDTGCFPVAICLGFAWTLFAGCAGHSPPATVEGTVRRGGDPLDNCLVVFLPESQTGDRTWRFVGLTDAHGHYRLQGDDRREGATVGLHRVTIEDLSVSTGVRRRDHGAVDAGDATDAQVPPAVRNSRVPEQYASATRTPLRKEVQPGHQIIDLEIE